MKDKKKIINKHEGLGAHLIPLAKIALSVFRLGEKRKHGKKKQNNYGETKRSKKSYSTKGQTFFGTLKTNNQSTFSS